MRPQMKNAVRNIVAGVFLSFLAAPAQGQPGYRPEYGYRREPMDAVRADLDRAAQDMNYLSRPEMARFNKVRREIAEFQQHWERGRFNRREFDDVIRALQAVVNRNRLHPRDRDRLMSDVGRLRDIRDRRY